MSHQVKPETWLIGQKLKSLRCFYQKAKVVYILAHDFRIFQNFSLLHSLSDIGFCPYGFRCRSENSLIFLSSPIHPCETTFSLGQRVRQSPGLTGNICHEQRREGRAPYLLTMSRKHVFLTILLWHLPNSTIC